MTDMTFTNQESAEAAVYATHAATALEMFYNDAGEDVLVETIRRHAYVKHAFSLIWTISEYQPLYWVEIELSDRTHEKSVFDFINERGDDEWDQIIPIWCEQNKRQLALLTQDKELAALFKVFFS